MRKRSSRRSAFSKKYRLIDWTVFDNKVRDNYLDEEELEDLYLALKHNRKVRLFWSDILQHEEMERFLSHPPLRKRIIFAVESVDRDWTSGVELPPLSDKYTANSYRQWWAQLEPGWQRVLRNAAEMADQPTDAEFVRLHNLKSLACCSTTITDLTPLRMLPNLLELDCSRTCITDLQPVQYLPNLRILYCDGTNITDLEPVRYLTKLRQLWCSHTQVRSVEPLRYLTQLQEVHCDHTCVESLKPLQDLPHLKELRCQDISELHELDTLLESLV